jgi:hypothetical protein
MSKARRLGHLGCSAILELSRLPRRPCLLLDLFRQDVSYHSRLRAPSILFQYLAFRLVLIAWDRGVCFGVRSELACGQALPGLGDHVPRIRLVNVI